MADRSRSHQNREVSIRVFLPAKSVGIGDNGFVVGLGEAGDELAANHGSAAVSSSRCVNHASLV